MISPLNAPVNLLICSTDGTIFSTPSGGGGGGQTYTFSNLGMSGARVYAQTISNNVQFRRISAGANTTITERTNDILIDVNDIAFDSTSPIKRNTPGMVGVTLGKQGVAATLQALLYPTLPPTLQLALSVSQFEFGDNSPINVAWTVTKTDENILTIQVGSVSQSPVTGNTQSGNQTINKDGSSSVTVPMGATTATNNVSTSATASASRKLRVGGSANDGIVNQITDAVINSLTSYYAPSKSLSPQTVIIGASQYLVIEIPTTYTGGNIPIFKINGFVNNAFTRVRSASNFTNTFGFSEPVDVFVSNQFSTGTITVEIV